MDNEKIDIKTEEEEKMQETAKEIEAKNDAKKFKRQIILLFSVGIMVLFVGMPAYYYIYGQKQKNAFLEGKTIWCTNANMLVKVSKEGGYSYDEKMNAFVNENEGISFYNSVDRCSY